MTATGPGSEFERDVLAVLASLEPGDVVTYGEVALEAGHRGRARAVGTLLARTDEDLPWWRVVNAAGRLVPGHEHEQARRLRLEGVAVDEDGGRVRLAPAGPRRPRADVQEPEPTGEATPEVGRRRPRGSGGSNALQRRT